MFIEGTTACATTVGSVRELNVTQVPIKRFSCTCTQETWHRYVIMWLPTYVRICCIFIRTIS